MAAMASQITSLTIVYLTVYSGVDQRKHQSSASLAFVRGIHRSPVNSPHKRPVTRKKVSIWWRHHGIRCVTMLNRVIMRPDSKLQIMFTKWYWHCSVRKTCKYLSFTIHTVINVTYTKAYSMSSCYSSLVHVVLWTRNQHCNAYIDE